MPHGHLLIVDNDPGILNSYADSLTRAGFDVAKSRDSAVALRSIEREPVEAILSGVSMPQLDGFNLLRTLRLRAPDVPVILMLDEPDNRMAIKGAELGAVQSLVKPIAPDLLVETASYAVRLCRSRRSVTPHYHRGERSKTASVSATDAKNEFGRILEKAIQGGTVVITKHDVPKAVLISMDEFNALSHAPSDELGTLARQFDQLLARMQTPASRAGMKAAFDASPKQLGKTALRAARKRG